MIHVLRFHIVYRNIILVKKEIEISIVKDVKIQFLPISMFFNFFFSISRHFTSNRYFVEREDEEL